MKSSAKSIALGGVLALAAGCGAEPLQPGSTGSGGGMIAIDGASAGGAGGAIDGGLATDAAWDAPFTGRRSYTVMSTLSPATSAGSGGTGGPGWHVFTMVVDADRRTAILGANASATLATVVPTPGGFQISGPIDFLLGAACVVSAASYDDLAFTFDPSGLLRGSGSGQLTNYNGDFGQSVAATMSLTGDLDSVGPTLSLASPGDPTDPFVSFGVVSSEPLPTQNWPLLRAGGGDVVTLMPSSTVDGYVTAFLMPSVLLRYGETYQVDVSGIDDFAGNPAGSGDTSGLRFTTVAAPPLIAADGFESVTTATLGGAQVLSAAGDPIISGTRSLYVPPVSGAGPVANVTQLALRLPVAPGSTELRFSYRDVNPTTATSATFEIASVGGSIVVMPPPGLVGSPTAATIGGTQVTLGEKTTAAILLPDDVSSELVVARTVWLSGPCGGPVPPSIPGIIIDDLRTE